MLRPAALLLQSCQIVGVKTVPPAIERLRGDAKVAAGQAYIPATVIIVKPVQAKLGSARDLPLSGKRRNDLRPRYNSPITPCRSQIHYDTYLTLGVSYVSGLAQVIDTALRPSVVFHHDQEERFKAERGNSSRPGKSKFLPFGWGWPSGSITW